MLRVRLSVGGVFLYFPSLVQCFAKVPGLWCWMRRFRIWASRSEPYHVTVHEPAPVIQTLHCVCVNPRCE